MFGSLAGAMADAAAYENHVVVLSLYKPGTFGTSGEVRWQDQMAMVPEPTTMLAGALLLVPFAASTIRRFRKVS